MSQPKNLFFIFTQLANFYCRITEKELYIYNGDFTGPEGLPYKEMLSKVGETITECNATYASFPYDPTPEQIAAMNQSLFWGKGKITGEYSLQMDFASEYSDSYFVNCFKDIMTPWAKANDYGTFQNSGLPTLLVAAGCLLIMIIGYCLCKRYCSDTTENQYSTLEGPILWRQPSEDIKENEIPMFIMHDTSYQSSSQMTAQ